MKSYKPPKAPSYKPPKSTAFKVPKAPAPPKSTAPKFKMPNATLTKVQQQRHTPTHDKTTSQVNKRNYNQQYNAFGLRSMLNFFKKFK